MDEQNYLTYLSYFDALVNNYQLNEFIAKETKVIFASNDVYSIYRRVLYITKCCCTSSNSVSFSCLLNQSLYGCCYFHNYSKFWKFLDSSRNKLLARGSFLVSLYFKIYRPDSLIVAFQTSLRKIDRIILISSICKRM